jgi:ABC-type Mn2+/Zn2+ transport system permease subunit
VLAPLRAVGSVLAELVASYQLDVPSGPAVVAIAGMLFLAAWGRTAWGAQRQRVKARRTTRGAA